MASSSKPITIEIPMPIKGVDRSSPVHAQPDLTCPAALNCRTFAPLTDRATVGKRHGHVRMFDSAAGGVGTRPINGLVASRRTIVEAIPTPGNWENVDDRMDQYGAAAPVYAWLGNYTFYSHLRTAAWSFGFQGATPPYFSLSGAANATKTMLLTAQNNAAYGAIIAAINYPTRNQLRMRIAAYDLADQTDAQSTGTNYQSTYLGPIVRASNGFNQFFCAYLQCVGTHQVQLCIDKHDNGAVTRIATSTRTLVLKGSGAYDSTLAIDLQATATTLRASVNWPTYMEPNADSLVVENNTDFATNNRAGFWYGLGDGVASANLRTVAQLLYSRLAPVQDTVMAEMNGGTYTPGSLLFVIPSSVVSANISAGATTQATTPYNSNSQPGGAGNACQPAIYTATNALLGGAARSTRTFLLTPAGSPGTDRYAADVRFDDANAGATDDNCGFCCRIHDGTNAYGNMLKVLVTRAASATTALQKQSHITAISVYKVVNGTPTLLGSTYTFAASGSTQAPVFSLQQPLRFTDDGTTISISQNGITLWSVDPSGLSSYDTLFNDKTKTRVGIDLNGVGAACQLKGVRFSKPGGAAAQSVTDGVDVVMATSGAIDIGDAINPAFITRVGSTGFTNPYPQLAVYENKVYGVDGEKSLVIDPVAKTIENYAAKKGTFPARCTLACLWRRRMVMAAPVNNRTQWSMSRQGDVYDFDYGSTVAPSTKAVTGTNSDLGEPPHPIIALIPHARDYLVFGCESSMWMMAGDPGFGGRLDLVADKVGIVGPRAWCRDANGSLFFLGTSGLYVMGRETRDIQPIGTKRLFRLLDRIALGSVRISMAFDSLHQAVHIFLTPTDGTTAGTHVVYQPGMDAFWLDQYPVRMGPQSVGELVGANDEDRRYLLGGLDGYVYRPQDAIRADDGSAIDAYVAMPPIDIGRGSFESMATELQAVGQIGAGVTNWYWRVDDSPVLVATQGLDTFAASGQWFGPGKEGYQTNINLRVRGGAHQLLIRQVSATDSFAVERAAVTMRAESRRRT